MQPRVVALILMLTLSQFVTPVACVAQEGRSIRRVGALIHGSAPSTEELTRSPWHQALADLGWVEGKTIAFERRYTEGDADRLPALAASLARIPVDVIWADTPPAVLAAKKATTTIPILFTGVVDPVGLGLVESMARPGGNVTGFTFLPTADVAGKQLEFLKEIVPSARRVASLIPRQASGNVAYGPATRAAAARLGVELKPFPVGRPEDYDEAFAAMLAWRAEALLVTGHPLLFAHTPKIVEFTLKHRLPASFGIWQMARHGGLVSYYPNHQERVQRWAAAIDRILRGARPGEIPVEEPTKFELLVNLKTARTLGLTIPASLLMRADRVIE